MFIIRTATFIIRMPCRPTRIFVILNIRFVNSKSLLKINSWPYMLFSIVGTCYQIDNIATITWQLSFSEICLTCYYTSKSLIKQFLQMSHLLKQTIILLLLMLDLGYKEGTTISFIEMQIANVFSNKTFTTG